MARGYMGSSPADPESVPNIPQLSRINSEADADAELADDFETDVVTVIEFSRRAAQEHGVNTTIDIPIIIDRVGQFHACFQVAKRFVTTVAGRVWAFIVILYAQSQRRGK